MKKFLIIIISFLIYNYTICDSHMLYIPKKVIKKYTSPMRINHYKLENSKDFVFIGEAVDVCPNEKTTIIGFINPPRIKYINNKQSFFILETGRGNFLVFKYVDEFGYNTYICSRKYTTNLSYPKGLLKLHKPEYSK